MKLDRKAIATDEFKHQADAFRAWVSVDIIVGLAAQTTSRKLSSTGTLEIFGQRPLLTEFVTEV